MPNEEATPQRKRCGSAINYHRLLEVDPEFRTRQLALEADTIEAANRASAFPEALPEPARIAIVVHVVHNTPAQNISASQIHSQIESLNRDFRARNADLAQVPTVWAGLVADAMIEFQLATTDPDGNATNGITRTETGITSFDIDDLMKFTATGGIDAWPTDQYLNIWVCQLSAGLHGYAQPPGGPADTDGIVILHSAFGTIGTATAPFHLGRVTTHEMGHFFNLVHIWGDTNDCSGTDLVSDTPRAQLPNAGTPTFPHISCNNGPDGDMFMNYMDSVEDEAMFMFTRGQVQRMAAALAGPRAGLIL